MTARLNHTIVAASDYPHALVAETIVPDRNENAAADARAADEPADNGRLTHLECPP